MTRGALLALGVGAAVAAGPLAGASFSTARGVLLGPSAAFAEQPAATGPTDATGAPAASAPTAAAGAGAGDTAADGASAEQLFEQANEAYKAGALAEAEALYRKALAKKRSYDIAANLARVLLDQQRFAEAAELLALVIDELPPSVSDAVRGRLGEALQEAASSSLELLIQPSASGALVRVDGRELGRSPLAHRVFVAPGEHNIEVTADGYEPATARVAGEAGAKAEAAVVLTARPSEPVTPSAGDGPPGWPIGVGIGLTAVLFGVGGVMAAVSAGQQSDGDTQRDALTPVLTQTGLRCTEAPGCAETDAAYADARASENASRGLFVAGGVVGAATLVYLIAWAASDSTADESTPAVATRIVPTVGPTEAGVTVAVSY